MVVVHRLKKYWHAYRAFHLQRSLMYSWKWRLFFVLLVTSAILLVNDYLQGKYAYIVDMNGNVFNLADRLFQWFMTGVLFGIIALGFLYEGEQMLAMRRMIKNVEAMGKKVVFNFMPKDAKTGKPGKKRKKG